MSESQRQEHVLGLRADRNVKGDGGGSVRSSRGKLDCEPCEVSQCVTYLPRESGVPGRQAGVAGVCAILCSPPYCGPGGNLVFKGKGRSGENGEVGAALTSDLGHCPARTHVPVGHLLSEIGSHPSPQQSLSPESLPRPEPAGLRKGRPAGVQGSPRGRMTRCSAGKHCLWVQEPDPVAFCLDTVCLL